MNRLLSILGPTASGKTSVAIELAKRLSGEIVSCDSMQIYRGMDIGTAKPTPDEQEAVPHHLIDILDMEEGFNARGFVNAADTAIRDVFIRGHQPIMCGGTGLYARSLLYGFNMWPTDKSVSAELRERFSEGEGEVLLDELRQRAPEWAARVQDNPRHWLRALEVIRITGKAPEEQESFDPPDYVTPEFILMPSAELSRERIRKRARVMLEDGWVEELERIGIDRFKAAPTACQALGYGAIIAFLDGGVQTREELLERIVVLTARYAKRQRTWFRNQHPNAHMISVAEDDTPVLLADRILGVFRD